jgi:hypothetical protein
VEAIGSWGDGREDAALRVPVRWFGPPRTVPLFADGIKAAGYADGYDKAGLGPNSAA